MDSVVNQWLVNSLMLLMNVDTNYFFYVNNYYYF